jgi:hypothetical protein
MYPLRGNQRFFNGLNEVLGRKIIKGLLLSSILLSASVPVLSQGGGKAEPLRIEFKRGAQSATVRGRVRRDEQAEYVFAARKGQQIAINLTSTPTNSARFELLIDAGDQSRSVEQAMRTWSGVAPQTGDFLVYVTKPDKKIVRSSYALTLKIE